ncbi:MAG: hypothetical protein P0S95_08220 [Rhabdochlamydiaceae bacterium]|nr:hypothetical protein [Candidatus Amphrikana amoebophyrae]
MASPVGSALKPTMFCDTPRGGEEGRAQLLLATPELSGTQTKLAVPLARRVVAIRPKPESESKSGEMGGAAKDGAAISSDDIGIDFSCFVKPERLEQAALLKVLAEGKKK